MQKQEIICPTCDEQYMIITKKRKHASFCPFCADPIVDEEQSELVMHDEEE